MGGPWCQQRFPRKNIGGATAMPVTIRSACCARLNLHGHWRNCLLLHGVPESIEDTTQAAITVGTAIADTDSYRPHPIIVKFTSYETRRRVFTAKRKLKGTKLVVTENLTKRRSELLKKVRSLQGRIRSG